MAGRRHRTVYNARTLSSPASTTEIWTTRRLLMWMAEFFTRKEVDSPRLCAELLLAHVLGCERLRLYMETDRPAGADELSRLRGLVERAGRHEPIQYILGEAWFFTRPFEVTPATLIPRPSTETIVEEALQHFRSRSRLGDPLTIIDIGTGSGILAITLAASLPAAQVIATDVSAQALEVARSNAQRHGVADRIEFVQGSLFEPLAHREPPIQADLLVSNPPYVSDAQWTEVARNVRDYEPPTALRAGADGLDLLRPLIARGHEVVRPGGMILFEIAATQAQAVENLAAANAALTEVRILKDHESFPRVLVAQVRSAT